MSNDNLRAAKKNKNDEFYTQYQDIQTEINAYLDYNSNLFKDKIVLCPCDDPEWSNFTKYFIDHFEEFGLLKLISTCYTEGGHGKLLIKDRNKTIKQELQGDGDFRSQEVTAIRDQADFIITNPPFSLFREFMNWIWAGPGLQFLVIGNMNAITYKEIFPKIKDNWMWTGAGGFKSMEYIKPDGSKQKMGNTCWFTNIDHGRRHQPLQLMTVAENLRLSKHDAIKGKTFEEAYPKYDNYEAIEVSYTDAIPKDYEGVMGVPISFLDKFCPEQFEIIGMAHGNMGQELGISAKFSEELCQKYLNKNKAFRKGFVCYTDNNNNLIVPYMRILIRKKSPAITLKTKKERKDE